jgi:methionyl-tRNA formyltransferase
MLKKKNYPMNKINFAFWGTPDVAAETLQILKQTDFIPSLIITSPDARAGRKMIMIPPPVKVWAEKNSISCIQPTELLSIFPDEGSRPVLGGGRKKEKLEEAKYDLFIVVAYGKIIPKNILEMPKLGSVNIHYSLLPKYRGASPVESAILNGEIETGVSIQQMEYKMDSGPLLAQKKVAILPDETAPELRKRLIQIGGELLVKTLPDFVAGKIKAIPQNEKESTHCGKIKKEDGLMDLNDDAIKNYNKFRAYAAWPRTFFFKDGKRVIITKAKLENNKFIVEKIIPEGGKEMDYKN